MNIGSYTFEEFKERAAAFHGYPAPGLLLGGYMVEAARRRLPEGTLFEALVETTKCLPDAVQLLTLCSTGNNWMKVVNLGKYALSLFDKYSGEGFRAHLHPEKLEKYPETSAWFLKRKPKDEQDAAKLLQEIEEAGEDVCVVTPVRIHPHFRGHAGMGEVGICPLCKEGFPLEDGIVCRGCRGEAPYGLLALNTTPVFAPTVVSVEDAVGKKALHDMTRIVPGESKGAEFSAGQSLSVGDICRLQQMGRFTVAVEDPACSGIHENAGAEAFARCMSGDNVAFSLPPKEGKINLRTTTDGLLCVDKKRLEAFNMTPDVICASRHDGTLLEKDAEFAGTRVVPLHLSENTFAAVLRVLDTPIFSVAPLRRAKAAILVTGTEIFQGLIKDGFLPVITAKLQRYGCDVVSGQIVPDDNAHIVRAVTVAREAGADLLVTTGGLSVDPEDVTRSALFEAGLRDAIYGAPVLPGTMSLIGRIAGSDAAALPSSPEKGQACILRQPEKGEMQVIGVPACALYFKVTLFDVLLPRLLAGRVLRRPDLAALGEGGFCAGCKRCTWPKCFFVK